MKISAAIITLNEEANLTRCLGSIRGLVDEVVVLDSGSTDATEQIARDHGARFEHQDWLGYVGQKNEVMARASHDWIWSIDADEEVSPELRASLERLRDGGEAGLPTGVVGFEVNRLVRYQGRWIYHGDWYPDPLVRLFRRDKCQFAGGRVHERLEVDGDIATLDGPLYHYTYRDRADRLARIRKYAKLWAESAQERGKRAGMLSPISHALVRFLKGYFLKRGFLDGFIGMEIAAGNAYEVWIKYKLLRAMTA